MEIRKKKIPRCQELDSEKCLLDNIRSWRRRVITAILGDEIGKRHCTRAVLYVYVLYKAEQRQHSAVPQNLA